MALGKIKKSKKSFGSVLYNPPAVAPGVPPAYPLDFYNYTVLGTPFYHFRSDWTGGASVINFKDESDQKAVVGSKVKTWKNTYLRVNQGDAIVPPMNMNGGNYWEKNYPILSERTYYEDNRSATYQGLKFKGTEYMEIEGRTVTDAYGLTEPLFSTAGTGLMDNPYKNTGASFLFVLHSDIPEHDQLISADYDPATDLADGHQLLFYSRQQIPCCYTAWPDNGAEGYTYPTDTEHYGLQLWFQGQNYRYFDPEPDPDDPRDFYFPKLGPQASWINPTSTELIGQINYYMQRPQPDPNCTTCPPYGFNDGIANGSSVYLGGLLAAYPNCPPSCWGCGAGSPHLAPEMSPGFQILLFEFDNTIVHNSTCGWIGNCSDGWEPGSGPLTRLYTYGNTKYQKQMTDFGGWVALGGGNSLTVSRSCGVLPATPNHTLWHEHLLFLAGAPPVRGQGSPPQGGKYAHGFRGTIYEIMMFEGKLSDADKTQLEEIFKKKYQVAIRT